MRSEFESFAAKFRSLISRREYTEAHALIESFVPTSSSESRACMQMRAQTLICQGRHADAKNIIANARLQWGDNVNLLCDLAICNYKLELKGQWKEAIEALKEALSEFQNRLGHESYYRAALILAKNFEELGRFGDAIKLYKSLETRFSEEADLHQDKRIRSMAQLLRVKSMSGMIQGMGEVYERLRFFSESELNYPTFIEIQHALLLAELHLVGLNGARARWAKLAMRSDFKISDRNLLAFDAVDSYLSCPTNNWAKSLADARAMIEFMNVRADDTFEMLLMKLLTEAGDHSLLTQEIFAKYDTLSDSSYLRLLTLVAGKGTRELNDQVQRHLLLLVDRFDPFSKSLWLNRISPCDATIQPIKKIVQLTASGDLLFEERYISIQQHSSVHEFFKRICQNDSASIDELSLLLYQAPYSPSNFERLRKTVQKANRFLMELTLVDKAFKLTKSGVEIDPSIQIVRD